MISIFSVIVLDEGCSIEGRCRPLFDDNFAQGHRAERAEEIIDGLIG